MLQLALSALLAVSSGHTADLVVHSGVVLTVDPARPVAEAFAVVGGRFVAIGDDAEVLALAGPLTARIDLAGAVVVPGFIDAHCHPAPVHPPGTKHHVVDVGPDYAPDIAALIQLLAHQAAATPPGEWVQGRGYRDHELGRHLTRADLDQVSKEHPVAVGHSSGHLTVFNSFALERARIDRDTQDPPGGAFVRDAEGVPTGRCEENARSVVYVRNVARPVASEDDEVLGLMRCFEAYLAKGITMVGHAGCSSDDLRRYRRAHAQGLRMRVYAMTSLASIERLADSGIEAPFGDEWLSLGGIKFFHGNSLSGRTCWLYEPYVDRPGYYGLPPARSQEDLDALVLRIHRAGLQCAIHANGDREIDMVLDALAAAQSASPRRGARHRIEHGSVVNERILARMKALDVVYVPHSYVYEHGATMEAYGEHRWPWMHANRSALELGIPVAGNSDSPVSAAHPMLRLQSLTTRRARNGKVYGAEQRLSFEQALGTFTLGAAYACFAEGRVGSISPGKLADFVILDRDPRAVDHTELGGVGVRETWLQGERAWPR